jgi:multiple sugar transport system permease protein
MAKKPIIGKHFFIYVILGFGSIFMVFPFIWMVLTSFKTNTEALRIPITFFPETFVLKNYIDVIAKLPFLNLYLNTFAVMAVRSFTCTTTCVLAGYAFGRIKFPGKNILFMVLLLQWMVPPEIFIIPQYLIVAKLGWINTVQALIMPGIVSIFGTFLLRQFFMSVPKELEESARIDGCNHWTICWRIMVPIAKTSLVTVVIFTSLWAWKEMMWPMVVAIDRPKMTLSAGLTSIKTNTSVDYTITIAGAVMAMVPMVTIYAFFQNQFVEGIAHTGIKG